MEKLKTFITNFIAFIIVAILALIALGISLLILGFVWNGVLTVWGWIL